MEKNDRSSFHSTFHIGGIPGCGGGRNSTSPLQTDYLLNCSSVSLNDSYPHNSTYYDEAYPDFSQIPTVRAVFVLLFVTECFVGVLGNVLVCLTVYRTKSMHSPVNYLFCNLGVCDFLVGSFVLPMKLFELIADSETNMMNDCWCTVLRFLESVFVFASVFTLVAICIERYYAVVYPVHSRINMSDGRIRRVILLVWFIPIVCASPCLYPATSDVSILRSDYGEISRTTCFDQFSSEFRFAYFLFLFFFMYIIPLVFIASTCLSITKVLMQKIPIHPNRDPRAIRLERGRRKVAKMVLVIVFAFIFCWSPYFIITAITQVHYNFFDRGQFFFTMLVINLLAFTHSCINPIVYFSMSARFRKGLMCIMEACVLAMGRSHLTPESSTSTIRRTSQRHHGPPTSYSEVQVYHCCHHNTRRKSENIAAGDNGSCHNFRHLDATTSNSSGKSANKGRRLSSRNGSSSEETADLFKRPVLLQYDSNRHPQCSSQLIPLQERRCRNTHFLRIP